MKKFLIIVSVILLFSACGKDDEDSSYNGKTETQFTDPTIQTTTGIENIDPDEFNRLTIDGMDCIIWKDARKLGANSAYSYSGLTCDWSTK